jgi:hypothetical protein
MELPTWAFKTQSRVKPDGSIDLVIGLRPLGRLYLVARAFLEIVRTTTITLTVEIQERRPVVTHAGERVEPDLAYTLRDDEIAELVKRVPIPKIPLLMGLARDQQILAGTATQFCTRPAPHVCKVNGPCNGFPRERAS